MPWFGSPSQRQVLLRLSSLYGNRVKINMALWVVVLLAELTLQVG
jgi:hypothetical protein